MMATSDHSAGVDDGSYDKLCWERSACAGWLAALQRAEGESLLDDDMRATGAGFSLYSKVGNEMQ